MGPGPASGEWWVICLCAQWCGVCRDWQAIFDESAASQPAMRFAWVDVEDEADAMGDVDVETFPTLLVARDGEPVFFGPVQPSGSQLTRLLASLRAGGGSAPPEARALMERLATRVLSNR